MVNIKCKTFWSSCRFKITLMYLIFEQMRLPKKINLIQIIVPVKMVYHFNFKYYYRPNLSIQNSITLISFNVYEETRGWLLTGPLTPKLLFCVDFSCTFCLFLVSSLIWIVSVFFFFQNSVCCVDCIYQVIVGIFPIFFQEISENSLITLVYYID